MLQAAGLNDRGFWGLHKYCERRNRSSGPPFPWHRLGAGQNRHTQRWPVPLADIEEQKLRSRIRELAQSHGRWGRRLV